MKILDLLNNKTLFESLQTVKLSDLYDIDELEDESEAMYSYISDEDLQRNFTIQTMTPARAKQFTTPRDDMSVWDSFKEYASKEQKKLVKDKIKNWDNSRILLTINNTLLDGNHHLVAGIFTNRPMKYINLAEKLIESAEFQPDEEPFPLAGSMVDGMTVHSDVPNTSSIASSLNDYVVLKGIREVPLAAFVSKKPTDLFYAVDDLEKSKKLAEEIKHNGYLKPLIVVMDKEGPYILEGAHRLAALMMLQKTSFPAVVVIDKENMNESVTTITESISFVPSYFDKEKNMQLTPSEKVEDECNMCGGDGKDYNGDGDCEYCKGKGRRVVSKYTVPELNVANSNGYLILQMLGYYSEGEDNSAGVIPHDKLPELRRLLIQLKNTDKKHNYVSEPSEYKTPIKTTVDKSGDVPKISRTGGSKVYDSGVAIHQIEKYINELLTMIELAHKKGFDISWH